MGALMYAQFWNGLLLIPEEKNNLCCGRQILDQGFEFATREMLSRGRPKRLTENVGKMSQADDIIL